MILVLIAMNVVVSLFAFRAFQEPGSGRANAFVFVPYQVARSENGLGMLLAHFSHGGLGHLALNMFGLYSFGGHVLAALGPANFLLVYAAAGLGSDLIVFALHKDDATYRCLGASGSVFGIVMAAVILDPTTSIALLLVPIPIPGPVFMLGYAMVAIVLIMRGSRGGISHEGHLGGAIVGAALTGVLSPQGLAPLLRWLAQWR